MLSALQAIADDPDNLFFGDAVLRQLRAKRSTLTSSASDLAAAQTRFSLGNLELQLLDTWV